MDSKHYLDDVLAMFKKYKQLADKALAQIPSDAMFVTLDSESNSIAIIMKHIAGNMRSRWTDFLITDGEKPDRFRDQEFVIGEADSSETLFDSWEAGWKCTLDAISSLGVQDLLKTVFIRGKPHSVVEAIQRQLTHYAYHVGQIVFLAKHFASDHWQSLSIPRGNSQEFEASIRRSSPPKREQ
ncbi:DUF1572 domain-containing protein [bacterium]|nr:DUF1572 domain-containing protein [bacterium]